MNASGTSFVSIFIVTTYKVKTFVCYKQVPYIPKKSLFNNYLSSLSNSPVDKNITKGYFIYKRTEYFH